MTRRSLRPSAAPRGTHKPRHSHSPLRWDDGLSETEYAKLRTLIERRLGFRMPPSKRTLLHGRMVRRARALHLPSLRDYCKRVLDGGEQGPEFTHFLDIVTTNVTSFFREPKQLERVQDALATHTKARSDVKVWSAACSRGHEVWTLGMILSELPSPPSFSIFGSDISSQVLAQAVTAVYPEAELAPVPAQWRKRYFMHSKQPGERLARVVPELRTRASFARLNLMDAAFSVPTDFDLVLLRNVLIYFDADTQRNVVSKVLRHLKPGGLLCVGLAESLHAHRLPLEHLQLGMYRKRAA
ncbi:MAG TPA: protein-glutamate O-methyltransferase CheR [Polyangiales bacterium]|nr:protein-glutamate O-methyltransferase CheR [Polyangiales bacterium]